MPSRIRLLSSTMMVSLLLMAALSLYRELSRRSDIWWTPRAMMIPLARSTNRVEIYAAGCAVTALMFLLVVTGRLAYRGEKGGALR